MRIDYFHIASSHKPIDFQCILVTIVLWNWSKQMKKKKKKQRDRQKKKGDVQVGYDTVKFKLIPVNSGFEVHTSTLKLIYKIG